MKITGKKQTSFGDLEEGDTFTEVGEEQILIKTDEGSGCCLGDGMLTNFKGGEGVVKVNCEVKVI